MGKLFCYELRRTVVSRTFAGELAVLLWFGWNTLQTETILGVAHTAPFSPWSFGGYLARLTPLLCLALLFSLRSLSTPAARRLEILTNATPTPPGRLLGIRCCAATAAALLLAGSIVILGLGFLAHLFDGEVSAAALAAPALLTLLPALMFTLGLGLLAGRLHPVLLTAAGVGLLLTELLPQAAALSCAGFFSGFPLTLDTLDPGFSVPAAALTVRLLYVGAGAGMAVAAVMIKRRTSAQ